MVVIWLLALCLAVPQAIQFGIVYEYSNGSAILDSARCSMKWTIVEHAFEISTMLFFVVPMTIITVLYILIAIQLRKSRLLTAAVNRNHLPAGSNHCDSVRGKSAGQKNVIRGHSLRGRYLVIDESLDVLPSVESSKGNFNL